MVEDAATADPAGLDIALFSSGAAASTELAPKFAAAGRRRHRQLLGVADGSRRPAGGPRGQCESALGAIPKGIVANPNCTTMVAMPVLKPLHDAAGLNRLIVSTYQAVSGSGLAGVAELDDQLVKAADGAAALTFDGGAVDVPRGHASSPTSSPTTCCPSPAHLVDDGSGETNEEQKFRDESRKILEHPRPGGDLHLRPGAGVHRALARHRRRVRAGSQSRARRARSLPGRPESSSRSCPRPLSAAGNDPTLVGRLRGPTVPGNGLALFVSGDNLRKGAALNAVQIAESLVLARGAFA